MSLTTLKHLWQYSLSDTDKEFWRQQFDSDQNTHESVRHLLRKQLKIDLQHDHQLAEFCDWESAQHNYELQCQRTDLENWQPPASNQDWSQFQELQLKQTCLQQALAPDQTLGLQAIRTATHLRTLELNRGKFKASQQTKIQAGLKALAEESQKSPRLLALIDQFRDALTAEDTGQNN